MSHDTELQFDVDNNRRRYLHDVSALTPHIKRERDDCIFLSRVGQFFAFEIHAMENISFQRRGKSVSPSLIVAHSQTYMRARSY